MNYHVRTLRRAQEDIESILDWIADTRQSLQGAAECIDSFEKAASGLANYSEARSFARENEEVPDIELRQFLFKTGRGRTYRGVYCVVQNEVRILRVRGPGQPDLTQDELETE